MTDTLGKAFLATQQAVKNPPLDSENPHFHSRFPSLGAYLREILHVANANGLVLVQEPVVLDDGAPGLRTRVIHADTFEFMESTMALILAKNDPQGQGSAITYARRYALAAIFGLVGEPDDDGHAASTVSTGSPQRRGGAQAAPAAAAETPSPSAAAPAAQALVAKAQQAQQEHRPPRPDLPVDTGRRTSKGDTILEAVTHVQCRPSRTTKDGKPIYVFAVMLDGELVEMTSLNDQTNQQAHELENTTARVEFVESGRFKNLWGVKPYEQVAGTFAGVAETGRAPVRPGDIPFGPVVW